MGFFGLIADELAIDLGTANTLIFCKGRGIVCREPSVVAIRDDRRGNRRVVAVGTEAKRMIGRTPESISAVRPLRDGVIADFEITTKLLRELLCKIGQHRRMARPRVLLTVPHGITEVERRAVIDSAESAGAREVLLVEEPMAAAIGAGLPIAAACGNMVLDIGGGTSEIAVISMNGVVYCESLRVGGDRMDAAIGGYLKRKYNVLLGERTAELLKINIGSVLPTGNELAMIVRGRDAVTGAPTALRVGEDDIREAIAEPVHLILELISGALENIPPELSADIIQRGITLTGGGCLLRNIDELVAQHTGFPAYRSDDPLSAVVRGSGALLEQPELMHELVT